MDMRVTFYSDSNGMRVQLADKPVTYTADLPDDSGHLEYAEDNTLVSIAIIDVADGVDLQAIPAEVRQELADLLSKRNVKVA